MEVVIEAAKQVPALAVLVFCVVHFLRHMERVSSAALKRHEDVAQVYRDSLDSHTKAIEHLTSEIRASKSVSARLSQIVLYHDATVKGQNPEALGSPQDLMKKILET